MSGPGPHEISPLRWDGAVRLSPGEGSRTRANRARRLRSVCRRGGMGVTACRVTADNVTAVRIAVNKPADRSSANTTETTSNVSRGENATRNTQQRAYRRRQAEKKVTDHGSISPGGCGSVGIVDWIRAMSTIFHSLEAKLSDVGLAKCCVCGRWGKLAR